MPKVTLPFEEYEVVAPLPPVCIRCGAPATRTLKMQLFKEANDEADYVVVDTPLCDGHPFMGQAKWIAYGGIAIIAVLCGLGALLKIWTHHYLVAFPLMGISLIWIALILYAAFSSIDCKGYTRKGVTVTGVSRAFIDALEEQDWTEEEFTAGLRKNRKARGRRGRPFWVSPWFYAPVIIGLCFAIGTPIGWVTASRLPKEAGGWPAGFWDAGGPGQPPLQPGQQAPAQPEPLVPQSLLGLIAYWPLDENQGGAAQDKVGNSFAVLQGGQWVPGVKGSALRLDGKNDFLDLGVDQRLNFGAGAPFTLAVWVNTHADEGVICSFRRRTGPFPVIDLVVKEGRVHGWVRDDNSGFGGARLTGAAVKDGQWHHVALVRREDGTVELFLDAASQGQARGEHSGGAITTDMRALGSERFVVQSRKGGGPTHFAGDVDELCVYGRALIAEEVAILSGAKR
jgi:hypothetical protein